MADISKVKNPDGNTYNIKDSTARDLIANKADKTVATTSANGLMSASDKKAIDREFFRMLPKGGTYIPPNADLNSIQYLKVGNYYNSLSADAATMKNCPGAAFMMYVLSPLSEGYDNESTAQWVYRLRIFVEYTGNNIFTQNVYSGNTAGSFTYGPWVKMTNSNDLGAVSKIINDHAANKNNPHSVTKAQIGLGNVDNTSDVDKPYYKLIGTTKTNTNKVGHFDFNDASCSLYKIKNFYAASGEGDYFYLLHKKSDYTITTTKHFSNTAYLFTANLAFDCTVATNLISESDPAILTIVRNNTITATDVLTLIFYEHRGWTSNALLNHWKLEIMAGNPNDSSYTKHTWKAGDWLTVFERTNVSDHINTLWCGLNPYHDDGLGYLYIKGIRITIYAATPYSTKSGDFGYNLLEIAGMRLLDSRPSFSPAEALGALDVAGGTVYGKTAFQEGISATSYSGATATSSADGLMSKSDKSKLDSVASTYATKNELASHSQNVSNPHKVTASQVGALPLSGGTLTGNLTAPSFNGKVNGYTISANVPSGAKFTDTTYSNATTSASGLMSSADKAKLDGIAAGAEFIDAIKACPPAISHRMIYRGKNLGTSFTTEQSQAVQNGTFTDMYVGDYWVINGKTRRIGDIDYFYGCGDTSLDQHHLLIVDDGVDLAGDGSTTHFMNDTDTTAGGFKGSKMWQSTIPNQILPDIITAFGSHLLTHREYISNAVTDGVPSDGEWVDTTYNLFNETMYYGSVVNGANIGGAGVFNIGCSKNQIALFKLDQSSMNRRNSIWLRDVVSNTAFALAYSFGYATGGFTSFPWFSILGYYLIH